MKTGKVLLGVLAGAATGALIGILFAPHKGSKTRKKIMNKGEGYADALKGKLNDMVDAISQKYESTLKDAEEIIAKGNEKYDEVKKDVLNATT